MQNKPGKTRQIHPLVLFIVLLFSSAFGVVLAQMIGLIPTIGFYGLSAFIVLIIVARAPNTGNQED